MTKQFYAAGLITILATILLFSAYEIALRTKKYEISFDDSPSLFAHARAKVYLPQNEATVFTGSSRMKYDICTDTWRSLTGETPVQLANVGSSPIPVVKDLAADPEFKGKLIIDATEGLFFDLAGWSYKRPNEMLKYYHEETPSQKFSYYVNDILESAFVFLDKESFSLSAILDRNIIWPRQGVREFPPYPINFSRLKRDRMQYLSEAFNNDSSEYNTMRKVWMGLAKDGSRRPPIPDHMVDSFLQDFKTHVDKIKSRGGKVIFVRPPSSGPLWQGEQMGFPRDRFWNKILKITNSQGIHFADYPEMTGFECPEYSHLSKQDAAVFTRHLVQALKNQGGWLQ